MVQCAGALKPFLLGFTALARLQGSKAVQD
jgi:hypothetical protein